MAVMTSQSGDNDALDLKSQPVEPFDKMTLNSDIVSATISLNTDTEHAPTTENLHVSPTEIPPSAVMSNALNFSDNQRNGTTQGTDTHTESDMVQDKAPAVQSPIVATLDTVAAPIGMVVNSISAPAMDDEPTSELHQVMATVPVEEGVTHFSEELAPDTSLLSVTEAVAAGESNPTDEGMDISEDHPSELPTATTELPHHPPMPIPADRIESPLASAPTPVDPGAVAPLRDYDMQEAPHSPGKVARGREDDDLEDGPATKRTRTDDDGFGLAEFKVPDLPQPTQTSSLENVTPAEQEQPPMFNVMTKARSKHLLHGLKNLKRTKDAAAFNLPVDPVKLNIPTYPDIIKHPMDLSTMEEKLREEKYSSVNDYISDFNQIIANSTTFNGPDHAVTKSANNLKPGFDRSLLNLPTENAVEPSPANKKAKKPQLQTALKAAPARRESRSSLGNARSPGTSVGSPQTFALNPQGVPLIRRDSTLGDGRPKREIHPPPPRDLPYSTAKPKKKKYQAELRFCQEVLNELEKVKYRGIGYAFYNPVDPVALNIPHYHKIIKKPMDLGTVSSKLKNGQYENAKEFESDIRLMFQNCYKFNPATDPVHQMGKQFEAVFDEQWAGKKEWLDDHAPQSGPQSPGSSPEPDEEEDEQEEEEEEEDNQLTILQKQIAAMSKQVEMIQKKKISPPAPSKKGAKSGKPVKKGGKKAGLPAGAPPHGKSDKKGQHKLKKEPKEPRAPYVTYEQKQDISTRINSLPEPRMQTALKIIRENMPGLKDGREADEIELDIDELSNEVLYKLLQFVRKYAPSNVGMESSVPSRVKDSPMPKPSSSKPKKNKPMSKYEQEARISELQGKLAGFHNQSSEGSPDPTTKAEAAQAESSGDESDSGSESEEE